MPAGTPANRARTYEKRKICLRYEKKKKETNGLAVKFLKYNYVHNIKVIYCLAECT